MGGTNRLEEPRGVRARLLEHSERKSLSQSQGYTESSEPTLGCPSPALAAVLEDDASTIVSGLTLEARPQSLAVVVNAALLVNVGVGVIAAAIYDLAIVATIGVYTSVSHRSSVQWEMERQVPVRTADLYRESDVASWLGDNGISISRQAVLLRSLMGNLNQRSSECHSIRENRCSIRGRDIIIRSEMTPHGILIRDAEFDEGLRNVCAD